MGFARRLAYFLVHTSKLTNQQVKNHLQHGDVEINGETVYENRILAGTEEIKLKGITLQAHKKMVYYAFYKPPGYESSFHSSISDNIAPFFDNAYELAIAGRLDKASEGLMLLSNDGKWVQRICHPAFEKEKEYEVEVDCPIDETFAQTMSKGIKLWDFTTQPCTVELTGPQQFRIILTEGKNRQIRRMCAKLGVTVIKLKRIRIDQWHLGDLAPGQIRQFSA